MEENTQDNTTDLNLTENEQTVLATTSECNHCGWTGPITSVKFDSGIFYCPECDKEFGPPADGHEAHD